MNKKQKKAKRKNAREHQQKVKDLAIQREQARAARGPIEQRLPKAVPHFHPPAPLADPLDDVFGKFFAEKLKEDGLAISPSNAKDFLTIASSYPIIGRKCK